MEKACGYRYILFDLDGTLTYSHRGIFACFRYALEKMGKELPTDEALRPCVGPSLMYSFQTFFKMTEEQAVEATRLYRERYSVIGWQENEEIEGAKELLADLKQAGYILALSTSKPKRYADRIVEKFGFDQYLTETVGPDADDKLSTKAAVIEETVRLLGADKKQCLMVGDTKFDVEGAALAGVDCVGLTLGYGSEEELRAYKPKYIFHTFSQLKAALCEGKNEGR